MIASHLMRLARICLAVLPIWIILRRPWRHRPLLREAALALFIAFMAGLLVMALDGKWDAPSVMFARARERLATCDNMNFIPLTVIRSQLQSLPSEGPLTLLLGNTLMFVPWGFCLPLLWRRLRRPLTLASLALLLPLFIETTQLFIARMVDVDDVLLNFLGSVTGSGLWDLLHRLVPPLDHLSK